MTATLTPVLLGPADADHYRVAVGRYKDRWYTDPLPGCELAEASDWTGPSISTVKKAASQDWSYVAMARCSRDIVAHPDRYRGDQAATYEQLNIANKLGLDIDAGRGTIVHAWQEDLLHGRPMREWSEWDLAAAKLSAESLAVALAYKPAIQAWHDTYGPELFAAEFVCIDRGLNGVGYGGTGDCILQIDGKLYVVDWKSRGPSSEHGAYPEEGAQVAALATAEYMIVCGPDGNPMRTRVPELDGGLIVSIKPDGCRSYPIDIVKAREHWTALHAWWCARRSERDAIGRSWPARAGKNSSESQPAVEADSLDEVIGGVTDGASTSSDARTGAAPNGSAQSSPPSVDAPPITDRRSSLLARYQAMSDDEKLAYTDLGINPNDLDAVEAGLDKVDKFNVVVEPAQPVKLEATEPPTPPDEGGPIDEADVAALQARFDELSDEAKLWTGTLIAQGKNAFPWRIKDRPTVRRFELYRGVLALAELGTVFDDDDVARGLLYSATGREEVAQESLPLGAALSTCDAVEAAAFANAAHDYGAMKIAR